jgi:DNA-binding GntR family transcriptional regulator
VTDAATAYAALRDRILRAAYRPGQVLSEDELTTSLSVGRTPLRDALQRLAHDGLVEIRPRQGTYVSQVTLDDLGEIFEARAAIERAIAAVALDRGGRPLQEGLEDLIRRSARTKGGRSDVSIDTAFHELLLTAVRNRYLAETYRRLLDASLRLLYLTGCGMESPQEQRRTLERVRGAVRDRDAGALEAALLDHLGAFRDRVSSSLFTGLATR